MFVLNFSYLLKTIVLANTLPVVSQRTDDKDMLFVPQVPWVSKVLIPGFDRECKIHIANLFLREYVSACEIYLHIQTLNICIYMSIQVISVIDLT